MIQGLHKLVHKKRISIRLPVHMGDRLRKLFRTARELEQELGHPPAIEEIAELVAIIRPACLDTGMSATYAKIKKGDEQPSYIHPIYEPRIGCAGVLGHPYLYAPSELVVRVPAKVELGEPCSRRRARTD